MPEDKKKEERIIAEIVEIPTQTQQAYKLSDGRTLGIYELFLEMYNDIQILKRML